MHNIRQAGSLCKVVPWHMMTGCGPRGGGDFHWVVRQAACMGMGGVRGRGTGVTQSFNSEQSTAAL